MVHFNFSQLYIKVVFALFNPSSWELRWRKIWLLHNLLVHIFPPKFKLSLAKALGQKFSRGSKIVNVWWQVGQTCSSKIMQLVAQNKKSQSWNESFYNLYESYQQKNFSIKAQTSHMHLLRLLLSHFGFVVFFIFFLSFQYFFWPVVHILILCWCNSNGAIFCLIFWRFHLLLV